MAVLRAQHGLMRRAIAGSAPLLALAFLAVVPKVGTAMEATCAGCLDNCCQWAFAARRAVYLRWQGTTVSAYSWQHWEQHGFPPSPCRELLEDWAAYEQCAWKAFSRCYKLRCKGCSGSWTPFFRLSFDERQRRGISGTKPVQLHAGQVIVIETGELHGAEDSRSDADQRPAGPGTPAPPRPPRRP